MLQKKKYDESLTNESYMKLFSSQFALADAAMRKAVYLIKSGKASEDGIINIATLVLKEIIQEHSKPASI